MRGQLYRGHANATALFSSPVVSALGSESDDPGSSPGRGKALCPWDVQEKKMRAPLLGLVKSIYYMLYMLYMFPLISKFNRSLERSYTLHQSFIKIIYNICKQIVCTRRTWEFANVRATECIYALTSLKDALHTTDRLLNPLEWT